MSKIVPRGDRVLVLLDAPEELSKTGLHLPTSQQRTGHGTVLAVGPGRMSDYGHFIGVESSVGDRVLVLGYVAHEEVEENLVLVKDSMIWGSIEESKEPVES